MRWLMLSMLTWTAAVAASDDELLVVEESELKHYWTQVKDKRPDYPREAAIDGIQGCVRVAFIIEPDGTTLQPKVIASVPPGVFDKRIVRYAKGWRYQPAESIETPEATYTSRTFTYQVGAAPDEERQQLRQLCGG